MPLKLNVGLSKKVGLPDYGSLGASCNVELELDAQLMARDAGLFQKQVQQAFAACSQAVQDELARQSAANVPHGNGPGRNGDGHTASPAVTGSHGDSSGNGSGRNGRAKSNGRKATSAQVRAIFAIAGQQQLDVAQELRNRFGVDRPDHLSIGDASQFIDELKGTTTRTGGG